MTKRYANLALIYAILAMVFGVFYREFTKFNGFTAKTSLSVMHTHYFMLGMVFFLLLMLLEKSFPFSDRKNVGALLLIYQIGLNIAGLAFLVRGITQVLQIGPSRGFDASISGIAGIGHIFLGVSMILLLFNIKKGAV